MIEEDISELREIVRGLHGRIGHVWTKGGSYENAKHEAFYMAICACGGEQSRLTREEWKALPADWELESKW